MIDATKYSTKELLVRKKIASFIEKIIRYFGNDVRHDIFKAVVYGEIGAATKSEEILKNYYDAYMYLLSNCKMVLSQDLLRKFFYILKGEVVDEALLIRVSSYIFHSLEQPLIKKLVNIPIYIYEQLNIDNECERTMTALMFFNYYLVRENVPTIPFLRADLDTYIELRDKKDTAALERFVFEIIQNAKFQEKEYYENLRDIDAIDIQKIFLSEKDVLVNNYGIKHVYIYGSFAKETQRIDSDIDVVFDFSYDLSYQEIIKIIDQLSKHYFKKFDRYIDIHESGTYVTDSIIKEISKYIKIY